MNTVWKTVNKVRKDREEQVLGEIARILAKRNAILETIAIVDASRQQIAVIRTAIVASLDSEMEKGNIDRLALRATAPFLQHLSAADEKMLVRRLSAEASLVHVRKVLRQAQIRYQAALLARMRTDEVLSMLRKNQLSMHERREEEAQDEVALTRYSS